MSKLVKSIHLTEYLFEVLSTLPADVKSDLTVNELKWINNPAQLKKFIERSTLDEVLNLLAKTGFSYTLTIRQKDTDLSDGIKNIINDIGYAKKRMQMVNALKENKVFVLCSSNVMLSLQVASVNTQHKVYMPDSKFKELQARNKKLTSIRSLDDEIHDMVDSTAWLSSLAISFMHIVSNCKNVLGITYGALEILLAIYPLRADFVSRERLMEALNTEKNKMGFSKMCGSLVSEGYLIRHPHRSKNDKMYHYYLISEKGIKIVLQYMKWLLN